MARILVVEDNLDLAAGIRHNLAREGYEVHLAEDGPEGLRLARSLAPDLIILDLMLPGLDGFAVLETVRAEGCRAPVLVLTARGEEMDRVRAFRLDADQYLTKPLGGLELIERVGMLLRRGPAAPAPASTAPPLERFGDVVVDRAARRVLKAGVEVALRPLEYDLLVALLAHEGQVLSRQRLLEHVWGYDASVQTRTVDWHVSELRAKLEADPADPRHIVTVWKVGYRFER